MLRVGFGGFFENDYFYELANRFGLLIWQEIAISDNSFCDKKDLSLLIKDKLQQRIQPLLQHPSVVLIVWTNGKRRWLMDLNKYFRVTALLEADYEKLFSNVLNQQDGGETTTASSGSCARNPLFNVTNHKDKEKLHCGEGKY